VFSKADTLAAFMAWFLPVPLSHPLVTGGGEDGGAGERDSEDARARTTEETNHRDTS
jgi:hypothetical protein